jgi:hypothetical protein
VTENSIEFSIINLLLVGNSGFKEVVGIRKALIK